MNAVSDEQQALRAARDLIRAKRYAEARARLAPLAHPTARAWLARLDELSPAIPQPPPREGSAAAGVVAALLVLALSTAAFLIFRQMPSIAPEPIPVAAGATTVPGCDGAQWWAQVNTIFARAEFDALASASGDATGEANALRQAREAFAAEPTPDCLASARADLLQGVDMQIDAYSLYDRRAPTPMMQRLYDSLLKYQVAARALAGLGVVFDDGTSFSQTLRMLVSDCPVELWLMETLYAKNDFFKLIEAAQSVINASDPASAMQNYVLDLSRAELTLKYAPNPPCVAAAKAHLLDAMEAYVNVVQAAQGRDANGINVHLETMQTRLRLFQSEVDALGASIDLDLGG